MCLQGKQANSTLHVCLIRMLCSYSNHSEDFRYTYLISILIKNNCLVTLVVCVKITKLGFLIDQSSRGHIIFFLLHCVRVLQDPLSHFTKALPV